MIFQARTARPEITLNGADYFTKLAPYFLNMTYVDNCDGQKADDLQLQLADRDRRFISDWSPDLGTFLDVSIIAERWFAPNAAALKLSCGRFWIDSVDFELPQHTVTIKGCSIPTDAHIKHGKEIRGWENQTLREIADQIAGENNMTVDYQSDYNPRFDFVEQNDESALAFLKKRCDESKLSLKIAQRKIIIYDEQKYDEKAPSFTVVYGNLTGGNYRMSAGKFTTMLTDKKKKVSVAHVSVETGHLLKESYTAPNFLEGVPGFGSGRSEFVTDTGASTNSDLPESWESKVAMNPDIADEDEEESPPPGLRRATGGLISGFEGGTSGGSERLAQALVREANKDKEIAEIELSLGNPLIAAGQTFTLKGVGRYDGKWFIKAIEHRVGPMFTSTMHVRRTLEGY